LQLHNIFKEDPKKGIDFMVRELQITDRVKFGFTKLFFSPWVIEQLENARELCMYKLFIIIQAGVRGWLCRNQLV